MPEAGDACYHALITVTHRRGSRSAAMSPGAYVRAWTFASSEAQAKADIAREATERFEAEAVKFEELGPGDPYEIEGVPPAGLRALFEAPPVVFGTPIGWARRRWWRFWRREA